MAETKRTEDGSADETAGSNDMGGRSVVDRRCGLDLRSAGSSERRSGIDRRDLTGLKRLRGPGRRRPEFNRAAEEGEFTKEQFLFVMAINAFKQANRKSFPAWTEVLEVIRKLGYRKTQGSELNLPNAEDWTESADAPAMAAVEGDEEGDEDEGLGEDVLDTLIDD